MLEEVFMKSGGPSITHSALHTRSPHRVTGAGVPARSACRAAPPHRQTSRMAVLPGALLRAAPGLGPPRNSDLFGEVIE